ncbi:MAG: urea ABC transporter ATP-binding protein UrtD [Solirubrobacteraceae bacterium]|nr:urea ABC transporter ATP-binding protein UrtD [Solirubrobacteraceae bacterium]
MADELLKIRGLEVDFDGFKAVDGVDVDVRVGEVHFLIGPNGAGKTTVIDCVTGMTKATGGSILFDETELRGKKENEVVKLGIGRTFQTASVFEALTVEENLDLAGAFRMSTFKLLRKRKGTTDVVKTALEATGLDEVRDKLAGTLSHGQKQWLEIGMLLCQDPKLLLLDEPVAGMSPEERTRTGELIRLTAENCTVLCVEHDMDFLRRFADRVTVMDEGKLLRANATVAEVQADERIQEIYIGKGRGIKEATT